MTDMTDQGGPAASVVRVLIADDHPVVRDGLVGMLGAEPGIEVVAVASGGREAVTLARHAVPDVVLMDLRMPDGSGVDAIRTLRSGPGPQPRSLVLTTYDTDRDVRGAIDAGADGFLLKDTRRADLVRAVRDLAEGRPVLAPVALAALTHRSAEVPLSAREVDVLRLVAEGRTNRAIAGRLGIGEATVKTHLMHVYDKLGVTDRASAVRAAWERGLV